jgi:TonB-dependent SusC/RagA subfamily outer membrane receptor
VLATLVGAAGSALAQEREVTGTVTRANGGQPIAEAAISVAGGGPRAAARTNAQGRYSITIAPGEVKLTVRAIGYRSADVVVAAGQETADVALGEDIFKLEELVVSGQQTGVERRNATTSTAIVTGEDLKQVQAATLDQALQGKLAGAHIEQNSGGPGGGLQIRIRGANTAIGSSDPLFVVDGVLYSNATLPSGLFTATGSSANRGRGELQDDAVNRLADLNPNDIASVEVLKGAAASSIYGSKAANGVVIITTNKGRVGRPKVNITQRFGFASLLRGPTQRAFTDSSALATYAETGKIDTTTIRSYEVNGQLPNHDLLGEVAGNKPFAWETLADVGGGDENTKYYISGGWTDNPGIIDNTFAKKQTIRVNLEQQLSRRLNLQVTSTFTRNQTDRGITNNDNNGGSVTYALRASSRCSTRMAPSTGWSRRISRATRCRRRTCRPTTSRSSASPAVPTCRSRRSPPNTRASGWSRPAAPTSSPRRRRSSHRRSCSGRCRTRCRACRRSRTATAGSSTGTGTRSTPTRRRAGPGTPRPRSARSTRTATSTGPRSSPWGCCRARPTSTRAPRWASSSSCGPPSGRWRSMGRKSWVCSMTAS